MSDAALDRGPYFPSPVIDWYRERPFKVAFAVSVVIHALLIALIPGLRSIPIETPRVLDVDIVPMPEQPIPRIQEKSVVPPRIVQPISEPVMRQPQPEPTPEPTVRKPQPEPTPEPVVRQPQPEPPPVPRADIIRTPRAEPKPEFVAPNPELRPEPRVEPRVETRPEPKIEPRPAPPPVARVDPGAEPRPPAPVEPRLEPRTEIRPEPRPQTLPRESPSPAAEPRVAPPVAAAAVVRPEPVATAPAPPVATAPAPPVATPQPEPSAARIDQGYENRSLLTYGQSISREIKRSQRYPRLAEHRGWEGIAEVLLQIAADGKVTGITLGKSSGHAILDEEAMNMVRRASSPLPQAPPDLRGRALVVSVPIVFRLKNS